MPYISESEYAELINKIVALEKERDRIVDLLESMMDKDLHFTDYSGETISLPVEKWNRILNELRG